MKKYNDYLTVYEGGKKESEKKDQDRIDRLRNELAELMDGEIDEDSVEKISEISWELESLEPVLHEFDMEKMKKEFFEVYYPLAIKVRNGK